MANNGSGGSVDYYELRRKHQEYKSATNRPEDGAEVAPPPARAEDAPYVRPVPPAEDVREEDRYPESRFAQSAPPVRAWSADDDLEDDEPEDDEPEDSGANPFQSFISAFNAIRSRIATRRAGAAREVLDDSDDGYDDEEPREERRGPFRFLRRHEEEPDADEPDEDEADGDEPDGDEPREDPFADEEAFAGEASEAEEEPFGEREIPAGQAEDIPAAQDAPYVPEIAEDFPDGEAAHTLGARDDAPYDEDDEDEAPRGGGFKRFLNLFVVREDRDEGEPIGEDDYEVDEPDAIESDQEQFDDSLFTRPREHGASEEEQKPMGEQENNKVNMTALMADGLEDGTLSRRERRLLKERQEALKRAAEPEAPEDASIDEPTREYKPVPRPQAQPDAAVPSEPVASLFGDDDLPRRRNAKRDDYDEDDYDEPKSRKHARRDEDDDEDDYDEPKSRKHARRDEDDDEDDYDEPKSRRRGRRDEDDDEDDYDEPKSRRRARRDDYDEDDEEPRRGRRYETYAEDDDDYEDDAPSFGHYVLGFFKVLIAVVLVAAVALFGLYFADQAIPGGVGAYAWLQKKAPVIDKILPPGEDDGADAGDAADALDLTTTSPDESASPDATNAGTVG